MSLVQTKALFLDRDGIINIDHGYVSEIAQFTFHEEIFSLLTYFQKKGFLLIIVTNQSGIGRGYYTQEAYQKLTHYMVEAFKAEGISIEAVYHCPHKPEDGCFCRKPKSGMFEQAQQDFNIDMARSWMIGDKVSDMQAAKKAGVKNRILVSDKPSKTAVYHVENLGMIKRIVQLDEE